MVDPTQASNESKTELPSSLWTAAWWKSTGMVAIGIALGLVLLLLIMLFARPLALLFLALCIAAGITPIAQRLSKPLPRTAAILLVYGVLLLFIIIALALFLPQVIGQLRGLAQRVPDLIERSRALLAQYNISEEQFQPLLSNLSQAGGGLVGLPLSLASGLLDAILVLIVSLYLLLDAPDIRRFILSLFGEPLRSHIDGVGVEMTRVMSGYVRGVAINILVVSTITTIGLTLIGLPFALVFGVITGLFEALPVIGSLIAAVPTVVFAFLQSPGTGLLTFIFVIIVQQVQGNLIAPNVMKENADVPRFIVPIAILAGGAIGGVLGALIAVPLIAVCGIFFVRVVAPFIRRQTGAV